MTNDILDIINNKLGGATQLPPIVNDSDEDSDVDDEYFDDIPLSSLSLPGRWYWNLNTILLIIILLCIFYIIWMQRASLRIKC